MNVDNNHGITISYCTFTTSRNHWFIYMSLIVIANISKYFYDIHYFESLVVIIVTLEMYILSHKLKIFYNISL